MPIAAPYWETPHPLIRHPEKVWETDAVVIAVWPAFHQAWLRTPEGQQLAVTGDTEGVRINALHEGQLLRCIVTVDFPRVLSASVID